MCIEMNYRKNTYNLKDVCRIIAKIEPNCGKIMRFEKVIFFLFGLDQIVGKFLQFEICVLD